MTITATIIACASVLLLCILLWQASEPPYKMIRCTNCGHPHYHVKRGDKRNCPCGKEITFT